jgi:hypothetical protein
MKAPRAAEQLVHLGLDPSNPLRQAVFEAPVAHDG